MNVEKTSAVCAALRVPPRLLRAIPILSLRRPALRTMNAALKRYPIRFDSMTSFGFRFAGTTGDVIQRHIYVFDVWEPDVTAWITTNVPVGSVVVDVGANVGYFTLLLSELVGPLGKVHSVEALPSTVRHLRRNIALNPHASRVVLHDVACRDHEGKVEMFRADSIGNSSTGSGEHSEGMVRCTSLDSLVDETDRPRISLIKVDTEGDEMAVLLGATDTLSAMRPGAAAIVEVTPAMLSARGYEAGEVMDLMSGIGFDAHSIENDYTPSRYADCRVQSPKRLLRMPTTAQEVLFVKR